MLDVFVSRPTWVAEEFRPGLDNFLEVLGKMELRPRTLGSTDQPTDCPLDEVIQLIDVCRGAVILGFPQLHVATGELKGVPLDAPLVLPTEWNHIEAGLAYARDLPLLVIHHSGIGRGIFDRGAISGFLHEVDFSNPAWSLGKPISGALTKWKAGVLEPRRGGAARPSDSHDHQASARRHPLSSDLIRVLQLLAQPNQTKLEPPALGRLLNVVEQKAQYYLDQLIEADLVDRHILGGRPMQYYLKPAGRAALVERGLL